MDIFKELKINLPNLEVEQYERYLPTAFDESLTILEKINKVIEYLNQYKLITEKMLIKWNEVYRWIMNEGLDNAVGDRLNEWLENGKFNDIINREIFGDLNNRLNDLEEQIDNFNSIILEFIDDINNVKDEFNSFKVDINQEITTLINEINDKRSNKENIEISVGVNGDFNTLNEAFIYISKYERIRGNNSNFKVNILKGTILSEQLIFDGEDYSHVTITSDTIITVDGNSFNKIVGYDNRLKPFIAGINSSKTPIIDALFKIEGNNEWVVGVLLDNNSSSIITENSGVTHTTGFGLRLMNNSIAYAEGSNFSHSTGRGCMISQGSILHAPRIDLSYSKGRNAFRAYRGCSATLEYSNMSYAGENACRISEGSHIDIQYSDLTNAGQINLENAGHSLNVYGSSMVYARGCNFSGAVGDGIRVSDSSSISVNGGCRAENCGGRGFNLFGNSKANAHSLVVRNCGGEGVHVSSNASADIGSSIIENNGGEAQVVANYGGRISASSSRVRGNNMGYRAMNGGYISGGNLNADNTQIAFSCYRGEMLIFDSSGKNANFKGAQISTISKFSASNCDFSGSGSMGVHGFRCSDVSLYSCDCRIGTGNSPNDIVATTGTIIKSSECEGGTNLTKNEINNEGLIIG